MCQVELSPSGQIRLFLPSEVGGHSVDIPCTVPGVQLLQKILIERARAPKQSTIGTDGSPTQQMVEHWLSVHSPTKPKSPAVEKLEAEGLDLEEFDLEIEI